jgi:hypothetical protein
LVALPPPPPPPPLLLLLLLLLVAPIPFLINRPRDHLFFFCGVGDAIESPETKTREAREKNFDKKVSSNLHNISPF